MASFPAFFRSSNKDNSAVMQASPIMPTMSAPLPKNRGRMSTERSIPAEPARKIASVFFSQPREFKMLVVIIVRLMGSSWKAHCEMSSPLAALE